MSDSDDTAEFKAALEHAQELRTIKTRDDVKEWTAREIPRLIDALTELAAELERSAEPALELAAQMGYPAALGFARLARQNLESTAAVLIAPPADIFADGNVVHVSDSAWRRGDV